ncbi:solute carrier family 35 member G1-like [Ptychodera flava]|uniref:solute carrier family 35 member G1-like n=1 Tax=Ptychodera flava TaxID=63121 RepID=UPI00396A83EC
MDASKGYINLDLVTNGGMTAEKSSPKQTGKDGDMDEKYVNSWIGVALALMCGMCNSVAYMFIVWVQIGGGSQFQIAFVSGVSMTFVSLLVVLCKKISLSADSSSTAFLVVCNGLIRTLSDIAIFYALPRAPVGNVAVIIYGCIPIFTVILSCCFLKECCRFHDFVAFMFIICGVFFIVKPHFIFHSLRNSFFEERDLAYVCAAAGSLGWATSLMIGRSVGDSVHPFTTVFYNGFVSLLVNAIILVFVSKPSNWILPAFAWISLFGVCSLNTVTEWSLFTALQLESAPTVVLLADIRIVVSYLLDVFVLHNRVDVWDLIGATLVTIATLVVAVASCWINVEDVSRHQELETLIVRDKTETDDKDNH